MLRLCWLSLDSNHQELYGIVIKDKAITGLMLSGAVYMEIITKDKLLAVKHCPLEAEVYILSTYRNTVYIRITYVELCFA